MIYAYPNLMNIEENCWELLTLRNVFLSLIDKVARENTWDIRAENIKRVSKKTL